MIHYASSASDPHVSYCPLVQVSLEYEMGGVPLREKRLKSNASVTVPIILRTFKLPGTLNIKSNFNFKLVNEL